MEQQSNKLIVDSKKNCYVLPNGFEPLQETAAAAELLPGIHVIRINKGAFNFYDGQQQPCVLLWIAGGVFKNKASDMPVSFSWACLNGCNDTCTLEVIAATKLHALFIDSNNADNSGQIELSILSESDETAEDSLSSEAAEFASVPVCACAAAASDETAKKVAGWYEVNENEDGKFSFVLKAGNGEVILSGEPRAQKESAEQDIDAVRANCAIDERYEKKISEKTSKPYFNLNDANNQIIGRSQDYSSEAACSKGMASVKRNGSSKVTKEMAEA